MPYIGPAATPFNRQVPARPALKFPGPRVDMAEGVPRVDGRRYGESAHP